MREIKFRIWNTEEYYYTDPEHLGEYHFGIGKGVDNASKDKIYNTKEWIWQQFAEFKDKNGKEVYEGDIVISFKACHEDSPTKNIVRFDSGCFRLFCAEMKRSTIPLHIYDSKYIEVIGNEFENAELLS